MKETNNDAPRRDEQMPELSQETPIQETERPCSVICPSGFLVAANEAAMDAADEDSFEELKGTRCYEFEAQDHREFLRLAHDAAHGKGQWEFCGKHSHENWEELTVFIEEYKRHEAPLAKITLLDNVEPDVADRPNVCDGLSDGAMRDAAQNIRIDTGEKQLPLDALVMDLAAGHNELEQYKKGSLSMYKTLDERLEEARQAKNSKASVAALTQARDSAFGLYLRIQRGDEELHGHRAGKYSGYFNDND